MTDIVSKEIRSKMMSRIRGKDTKPELLVRKKLWSRGYRYRLHSRNLPGKPDLVLRKYKAVIFINGCFWHYHDCHLFKMPPKIFWKNKISQNKDRDKQNLCHLLEVEWRVMIIWECALKGKHKRDIENVIDLTIKWLEGDEQFFAIEGILKNAK